MDVPEAPCLRAFVTNWYFKRQLIKDDFDAPVTRGFIIYTRSRYKLIEVPIPPIGLIRGINCLGDKKLSLTWAFLLPASIR